MNMKQFVASGDYLIDEVKRRAETGAKHFFDADTMRFFSSRVSELAWSHEDDIYFITSEADNGSTKHAGSVRAWTVRKSDKDGDITTIGEFQGEPTLNEARKTIKEIMETGEVCSCCGSLEKVMPKAGSGTVTHWICLKCVTSRKIEVLPEYLENIKKFGHWHNSTEAAKND